jgi:hypothetical protein
MQPESSDGFASVGTVLPKEEAALLPGGLFIFLTPIDSTLRCVAIGSDACGKDGRTAGNADPLNGREIAAESRGRAFSKEAEGRFCGSAQCR